MGDSRCTSLCTQSPLPSQFCAEVIQDGMGLIPGRSTSCTQFSSIYDWINLDVMRINSKRQHHNQLRNYQKLLWLCLLEVRWTGSLQNSEPWCSNDLGNSYEICTSYLIPEKLSEDRFRLDRRFCDQILVGKRLTRSIRLTSFRTSPNSMLVPKCWGFSNMFQ